MIALLQRVNSASVSVSNKTISKTGIGLLVLLSIQEDDHISDIEYIVSKINSLKIFSSGEDHFSKTIKEIKGSQILLVSQFTLYANLRKGSRPSFSKAMKGNQAKILYEEFGSRLELEGHDVKYGKFGAYMQIGSINDGPVSLILTSDHLKVKTKI